MTKYSLLFISLIIGLSQTIAQQIDQAYNEKIKAYTTDERFLPETVLNLPLHPKIPSHLAHFGEIIGAPDILHRSTEIFSYFDKLSNTSTRLKWEKVGTSEEGRPMYLAIIGSEETLNRIHHYKSQLAKLADPREFSSNDLETILSDSKPVYYVNGGMHSTETGSPEMLMELAYRLVTSEENNIKEIRKNLVILINPISEPDGWDKQVDWYNRHTKHLEKEEEVKLTLSPPYWGKYTFHDNNRDGIQVTQEITKTLHSIYHDWHPTVMLDLHESLPLFYTSMGTGPYNDNYDPILVAEWQTMAHHDLNTLAQQGLPGAFTWAFTDGWWIGYGMWVASNHNSTGRFFETFGNAGANTLMRDLSFYNYAGEPVTSKQWYRQTPPPQKIYWSFRNNINYMQAGVLASLEYAAKNPNFLLKNFYQKGYNSWKKGENESPKAFTIPKTQRDPAMAIYTVNQLLTQKIEVLERDEDYLVPLQQPYRNLALSLLSKQDYPKDSKFPPYDDVAWTLSLMNGVEVITLDTLPEKVGGSKISEKMHYIGKITGKGKNLLIPNQRQNTLLGALYQIGEEKPDIRVAVLHKPIILQYDTLPLGSVMIENIDADLANSLAQSFSIDSEWVDIEVEASNWKPLSLPRIGLYHTWYSTQDHGWARFTFEERGVPFESLHKDHIRAGHLKEKYDVIIVPRIGSGSSNDFINGISSDFSPMAYTQTDAYPSHGFPDSSDDITGGPGLLGLANLSDFVEQGGVLISMGRSTSLLAEVGLIPKLTPAPKTDLFHPGSIVNAKVRKREHPVLFGYGETFPLFMGNDPLVQTNLYFRDHMVLQFGEDLLKDEKPYEGEVWGADNDKGEVREEEETGPYVLSGMVRNEEKIIGHGAIFDVQVGKGHILGFTFNPLHRFLNHHDAPMLWNALMNWNHLDKKSSQP
ncbi:M14 family zinc carboxypeptidase [Pleomorphovibrio marinus]|uniref:M14 family zinc carboxypeptidase n=1 Tax=Pleomorphovibrio marinus TaxID=2164132 RepID=UPI000E09F6F6|nr:M14 family zinc carboxypeptidase [Pleomorphovibrio marinus]